MILSNQGSNNQLNRLSSSKSIIQEARNQQVNSSAKLIEDKKPKSPEEKKITLQSVKTPVEPKTVKDQSEAKIQPLLP